ncbi:hypothetical protein [Herbaspirillum sp. YR522]|uniref:hypothetical protein n=1 Tax=Herbaspirillum sp. YR522 TaxID=1144342 RepID=UPI00026F881D|nr:hypothetical protein [Herbaspirillum sp. YR522]EJN08016.1 hypothetical protein PMI40_01503 [Herbaspirillum sp. YR522]
MNISSVASSRSPARGNPSTPASPPVASTPRASPAPPAGVTGSGRSAGNAALATLSAAQRQRLELLFSQRLQPERIKVTNSQIQRPADPLRVLQLQQRGSDYTLAPTVEGASTPVPHGLFMYVILADDPARIHLGVPMGAGTADARQFGVQGHTSLSHREDVLYAGDLVLDQGKLVSWSNSSGHYKPKEELRHGNLLPSVKRMLPDEKFTDFWHEMTHAQRIELLAQRGYAIPGPAVPVAGAVAGKPVPAPAAGAEVMHGDMPPGIQGAAGDAGEAVAGGHLQDVLERGQATPLGGAGGKLDVETLGAMGATLDGAAIRQALDQGGVADADVADRLLFDGEGVARMFQDGRGEQGLAALLDVAAARRSDAPLIRPDPSQPWVGAMNRHLGRLKGLDARTAQSAAGNPVTYLLPGGGAVQHVGTGLQAFGVYQALRGIGNALARGDAPDAAINGAGLAAQVVSLGLESGLPRLGNHLGKGGSEAFNAFARTPLGVRLGGQARLGAGIGHAASAAGVVLTLPFDIYGAVNAFQHAGATSGKQQQDHLVDGSFAVAGAAASVGLAGAAAAGLTAAGPIGIAVGVALAGANHLYHSIRYVEDIERHVPLSHGQRFVTGLSSFFGGTASQAIQDQVSVAQARDHYRDTKRTQLQAYLNDSPHAHAIFGDAIIRARPPLKSIQTKTALAAGGPYTYRVETFTQQPATVRDNAGDDDIDASGGIERVTNLASAARAAGTSLLWVTGAGKDKLKGDLGRSNVFQVGAGQKHITGGDRDDRFDLRQPPTDGSVLDGGRGQDTLALHFGAAAATASAASPHPAPPSVRVVLPVVSGEKPPPPIPTDIPGVSYQPTTALVRVLPGAPPTDTRGWLEAGARRTSLLDIDHVVTSASARTEVTGNRDDNVIALNGDGDSAIGGGGDDSFLVNGSRARIVASAGSNRYVIAGHVRRVDIDNAQAPSARHHLQLDVDIGQLSVMAAGASLELRLDGSDADGRIVLGNVFTVDRQGQATAALADGDVVITTRDGFALTPTLSSIGDHPDGMIGLVAVDHGLLQGRVSSPA